MATVAEATAKQGGEGVVEGGGALSKRIGKKVFILVVLLFLVVIVVIVILVTPKPTPFKMHLSDHLSDPSLHVRNLPNVAGVLGGSQVRRLKNSNNRKLPAAIWSSDAIHSNVEFSHMKIDEIYLNFTAIFLQSNPQGVAPPRTATLFTGNHLGHVFAVDVKKGVGITNEVAIPSPPPSNAYYGIVAMINRSFKVKGYCRTNNNIVYTTSNGIVVTPISGFSSTTAPDDYAPFYIENVIPGCNPLINGPLCFSATFNQYFKISYNNKGKTSNQYNILYYYYNYNNNIRS